MGRSAACAPLRAARPAAEQRIRLLISFMLTSKLFSLEAPYPPGVVSLRAGSPQKPLDGFALVAPHERGTCASIERDDPEPPAVGNNYECITSLIEIPYFITYILLGIMCLSCNCRKISRQSQTWPFS